MEKYPKYRARTIGKLPNQKRGSFTLSFIYTEVSYYYLMQNKLISFFSITLRTLPISQRSRFGSGQYTLAEFQTHRNNRPDGSELSRVLF